MKERETAQHIGLIAFCVLMAATILFFRDEIDFLVVIAIALIGVAVYSGAYIYLLNTTEGIFDFGEEETAWRDPIEQVALDDGERIIVNGQPKRIPETIRPAITEIIRYRNEGLLETISLRELHGLEIASRFDGSAQAVMDWLIENGVVDQKPRSAGEWVGTLTSPTPNGVSNGNGHS